MKEWIERENWKGIRNSNRGIELYSSAANGGRRNQNDFNMSTLFTFRNLVRPFTTLAGMGFLHDEQWWHLALFQNPDTRSLMQETFYRLKQHLTRTVMHNRNSCEFSLHQPIPSIKPHVTMLSYYALVKSPFIAN